MKQLGVYRNALSTAVWGYALPVAVILTGAVVSAPAPTLAQESRLRTLSVTGQGVEMIETTLAEVSLGVVVQGRTAAQAQQDAAQNTDSVVNQLRSQNVEQLETTGVNLRPVYDYTNNTERIVGYTATNTVKFRVAIDQAGAVMDEAVNAGATQITSLQFIAEDDAIAAAQLQALQSATADAQAQADAVLSTLGLNAQDIVAIEINNAAAPPLPLTSIAELSAVSSARDVSSPVIGGEQKVTAAVTLHIRY